MYIEVLDTNDTIHLHPNIMNKHKIIAKRLIIQYGALKRELAVHVNDQLAENSIGLPLDFFEKVTIPKNIQFEIAFDGRVLRIGPVIAFIATINSKRLTEKALNSYKKRLLHYKEIRGLIFVAASNSINTKANTISGYYYKPGEDGAQATWIKGTFPYPNAMYNRVRLRKRQYDSLISVMGDKVFNSYLFNKEELMDYISREPLFKEMFPYTESYKTYGQLLKFLQHYNVVYLKPVDGSHGRGIFQIEKVSDEQIVVRSQNKSEQVFNNLMDVENAIVEFIQNKRYLIQQGVPTKLDGHHVDFRAYLQKGKRAKWEFQGMVARIAIKDSIVTNLAYVEKLLMGRAALEQIFKMNQANISQIETRIHEQCIKACQAIDTYIGNYGDVAIDFVINEQGSIIILEMNKAYTCKSLEILKEYELHERLMATPFEYAKVLAGF